MYIQSIIDRFISVKEMPLAGPQKSCFFTMPGSLPSLFSESVEGFCVPAGTQKPSTLSYKRRRRAGN